MMVLALSLMSLHYMQPKKQILTKTSHFQILAAFPFKIKKH
jgi:hypothetical protein